MDELNGEVQEGREGIHKGDECLYEWLKYEASKVMTMMMTIGYEGTFVRTMRRKQGKRVFYHNRPPIRGLVARKGPNILDPPASPPLKTFGLHRWTVGWLIPLMSVFLKDRSRQTRYNCRIVDEVWLQTSQDDATSAIAMAHPKGGEEIWSLILPHLLSRHPLPRVAFNSLYSPPTESNHPCNPLSSSLRPLDR